LGDDLAALAVFERVKHGLRPKARASLIEVFQEYMHDHPSEVASALAAQADDVDGYGRESAEDYFGRLAAGSP
jgi:hypothetical protein